MERKSKNEDVYVYNYIYIYISFPSNTTDKKGNFEWAIIFS